MHVKNLFDRNFTSIETSETDSSSIISKTFVPSKSANPHSAIHSVLVANYQPSEIRADKIPLESLVRRDNFRQQLQYW